DYSSKPKMKVEQVIIAEICFHVRRRGDCGGGGGGGGGCGGATVCGGGGGGVAVVCGGGGTKRMDKYCLEILCRVNIT
ncbi:hypothetical protein Tco_1422489, partial [Tanacetum coccineum]